MAIIAEFDLALREADPQGEPDQIMFCGQAFTVVDQVGTMPLMRYAHVQVSDDATETDVLAAAYDLLQHCIVEAHWARFEQVATDRKAQLWDLAKVAGAVYRHIAARPMRRSTDSSDGPPTTSETSKPDSSSSASARPSRPDLAVPMVPVDQLA